MPLISASHIPTVLKFFVENLDLLPRISLCRSQGSNSAYFRLLVFYNSYIFFSHFFFLWFTVVYLRLPLTLSFGDSSPIFLFYNFCLVFIGTPTSCSRVWPFLNELKLINVRDQKNELHKTNKRPSPQLNFNWYVLFISI